VDKALQARKEAGNPVKVGMIAGFMGRRIANQIIKSVPGMEIVAISIGTWMELSEPILKLALRKFKLSRLSLSRMPLPKGNMQ